MSFEINPGEKVGFVQSDEYDGETNLHCQGRHSWKNRSGEEHIATVIWRGHLKNWVNSSSQPINHYTAYVNLLVSWFLCQCSLDCLEDPTILSSSLRSTLDVFEEYQDAEIVS